MYLRGRETERGLCVDTDGFLLVHIPSTCNGWSWDGPKLGGRHWCLLWVAESTCLEMLAAASQCLHKKLESGAPGGDRPQAVQFGVQLS